MSTQHPRLLCLDVHAFVCNENTFVCTVHPFTHTWACCSPAFSMPLLSQAPRCGILRRSSSNYHMLLIMQSCQQFVFMESRSPAPAATSCPPLSSAVEMQWKSVAWILGFLLTLARASQLPASAPAHSGTIFRACGRVPKAGSQGSSRQRAPLWP